MERYLDVVLPALRRRGNRVHVLARIVSAIRPQTHPVPWADEHDAPVVAAADAVRTAIAELRPDAVIVHNVLDAGVVEAARTASRMIYHVHDHRPFCPNGDRLYPRSGRRCDSPLGFGCVVHSLTDGCMYGPRPPSLQLLRKRERLRDAIAAGDTVIANSPFIGRRAAESGVPGAHAIALPLPPEAYVERPQPGDGSLLFIGRVQPQKGLRTLVRALASISPERRPLLRVVGDGPDLAACVSDAGRLAVTLHVIGRRDATGVRAALDAAVALALPSLWDEPFGYVGIEAFARGKPVVAFDVGGISWWLHDGSNGVLAPAADECALGAAIERVVARAPELGANARADAEAYREDAIVDALCAAYVP
jgi:glycosyltransferase involved in cell wall biosynthesis